MRLAGRAWIVVLSCYVLGCTLLLFHITNPILLHPRSVLYLCVTLWGDPTSYDKTCFEDAGDT